jgi:O-acetylhomoserine (thiol)-lyase
MSLKFETLQIHAGLSLDNEARSCSTPLYQTASYVFKDSQHAADLFELKAFGHIYSRISNPTVAVLEERVAALEGGVGALAVSSGHAAQFLTILNLVKPGQNIVSSPYPYGGTVSQFKHSFRNFGVESRIAASDKIEDFLPLVDENTRALYMETISNPGFSIPDFEAFAKLARELNIPLIVDNTFAGAGYLCRPFDYGANIVLESGTKWIGGHGTSIAGLIVDGGNYNWGNGKFPQFTEPAPEYHGVNFHESFAELAFLVRARGIGLRDFGPSLSPFNAYMLLQGLETLSLRMERHCENALKLAEWLKDQPSVDRVIYPGLPGDPNHANARKYLKNGFGPVLSFELKGGKESGIRVVDSLELVKHTANVGDVRTLVIQPATSTHQQLTPEEQIAAGVSPGLIRVSAGIENIDDIIADFSQALEKI